MLSEHISHVLVRLDDFTEMQTVIALYFLIILMCNRSFGSADSARRVYGHGPIQQHQKLTIFSPNVFSCLFRACDRLASEFVRKPAIETTNWYGLFRNMQDLFCHL